jgi:uncharacterized RDD family membrane protein YckC
MEPAGYRSAAARKRMSIGVWLVAVPLYLVQLGASIALLWAAGVAIYKGLFGGPEVALESAVLFDDRVHVLARESEARSCAAGTAAWSLLRLDPKHHEPERVLTECVEHDYGDGFLAQQNGALLWITHERIRRIVNGELVSNVASDLPSRSRVIMDRGAPAAVSIERSAVVLHALEGDRWVERQRAQIDLGRYAWDAVVVPDGPIFHVFTREDRLVVHRAIRSTGASGEVLQHEPPVARLHLRADAFDAGMIGGRLHVFALPPHPLGYATGNAVVATAFDGERWREVARGESYAFRLGLVADSPMAIARRADDGLAVSVVTMDGDTLRSHAYGSDRIRPGAEALVAYSLLGPTCVTLLAAFLLGGLVRRYRLPIYRPGVEYAPLFHRAVAKLVDVYFAFAPVALIVFVKRDDDAFMANGTPTTLAIAWVIFSALAYAVLEGTVGWTPGKLLMGIRVVRYDLGRCGVWPAIVRAVAGIVDVCFGGFVGLLAVALGRYQQRVGDLMAHTIVIRARTAPREVYEKTLRFPSPQPGG